MSFMERDIDFILRDWDLQPGVTQSEPIGLDRNRLIGGQQRHNRSQRLFHAFTLRCGIDTHHVGIRR